MISQYDSFPVSHEYFPGKETTGPILSPWKNLNTTFSAQFYTSTENTWIA